MALPESDDRDFDRPVPQEDRPTIPVPARESGVQLRETGRGEHPWPVATVDLVLCDLSHDPRSEEFGSEEEPNGSRVSGARRLYLPRDLEPSDE